MKLKAPLKMKNTEIIIHNFVLLGKRKLTLKYNGKDRKVETGESGSKWQYINAV